MKARRKSDGKIIEVETYMLNSRRGKEGSWESSYKDINSGLVYEASELLFNLNYYAVISGWVARNEDGTPYLHRLLPERGFDDDRNVGIWGNCIGYQMIVPERLFPDLTWSSDPIEVDITIKPKKKSSTK